MRKRRMLYGDSFYGNEASNYAKENGYLDYGTFSEAFEAVMANDIINHSEDWEFIHGLDEDGEIPEIFQFFIIPEYATTIIAEWTDDPIILLNDLDLYLWGITHYGTSWDYVLTDIKLNCGDAAFENVQYDDE